MTLQINLEALLPILEVANEWGIPHQEIKRLGSLAKITLLTSHAKLTLLEIPVSGEAKKNMIRKLRDEGTPPLEADRLIHLALRELNMKISAIEKLKIFNIVQLLDQPVAVQPKDIATLLSNDTVTLNRVMSSDRKNAYQIMSLNHNQLVLTINHKEVGLTIGYSNLFITPEEKDRFERAHIINKKITTPTVIKEQASPPVAKELENILINEKVYVKKRKRKVSNKFTIIALLANAFLKKTDENFKIGHDLDTSKVAVHLYKQIQKVSESLNKAPLILEIKTIKDAINFSVQSLQNVFTKETSPNPISINEPILTGFLILLFVNNSECKFKRGDRPCISSIALHITTIMDQVSKNYKPLTPVGFGIKSIGPILSKSIASLDKLYERKISLSEISK